MAEVAGPLLQQGEALPAESQSIYADLLLALLGHDGDVFIKAEDADRIQLSELVDWIPDADRSGSGAGWWVVSVALQAMYIGGSDDYVAWHTADVSKHVLAPSTGLP